jgi:hypothetical protein
MRKVLIGAAAGALLAPVAANAETTGFIQVGYEHSESGPDTLDSWGLGGAVQHDFANGWGVQAEAHSTQFDNTSFVVTADYAALHVYTALNQKVDIAAFVGMLSLPRGGDAFDLGVEARIHQGQWSLQGSVAYLEYPNAPGPSYAWDARVRGDWFVNQDTALIPVISYFEWHEGNFTHKSLEVGAGAAHRFANGLEINAFYVHSENDSTPIGTYQVDTLRLGLRLHLNAGDLQTIAVDGASWNGAAGVFENYGRF